MGNTTRRQPITHSIPAAPNYKFLNITDFRGLNITDNPFTAQPNTASDCLNVYVDENNTLSTRPRLEKRINFATNGYSVVNVYPLNEGYLVHRKKDDAYYMSIVKPEDLTNLIPVGGRTPTSVSQLKVFQQNNIIYILDGYGIYTITEENGTYTLATIEPYIPTVYSGLSFGEYGVDNLEQLEPYNLLTDKYKETYFWDGVSEIKISNPEMVSTDNKYFIDKYTNGNNLVQDNMILVYNTEEKAFVSRGKLENFRADSDFSNTLSYYLFWYHQSLTNEDVLEGGRCYYTNDLGERVYIVLPYDQEAYNYVISGNGDVIVLRDAANNTGVAYVRKNNEEYDKYTFTPGLFGKLLKLSYNGTFLYKEFNDGTTRVDFINYYKPDLTCDASVRYDGAKKWFVYFGKDERKWVLIDAATNNNKIYFVNDVLLTDRTDYRITLPDSYIIDDKLFINDNSYVSIVGNNFSLADGYTTLLMENIYESNPSKYYITDSTIDYFRWSENNQYGYARKGNRLLIFPKVSADNLDYYDACLELPSVYGEIYYEPYDVFVIFGSNNTTDNASILKYEDNHEPNVISMNKISDKNKDYIKHLENSKLLRKAKLYTRFDNKMWLAHKNRLFYSKYDNLNYFPITQYDIIGDDTDVTSFNLASDSLLIVYKNNAICTVYPTTVNNEYTYVFADSKNTVGNDAIGNSIVSVLTERPLQITTKGIYALKQVENIESNSRISELISEQINKKWLQESDYVPQCITMNRLYWTYFILPYDKYTKVYLLDNRTSSWYYWELPVVTINAFVKDDKSMIVSSNGRLYSLETTDTISPHNPDTTEYYDDDRKLIKWYWTSQILPLGTINYSKRLVDTTFIVADTDASDSYALNYKFKTYRKLASESNATTITNRLNYIQSTTKKTLIPRFNFIQIEISNVEEDAAEALDNNKIRLVGLGLKYILLEALI